MRSNRLHKELDNLEGPLEAGSVVWEDEDTVEWDRRPAKDVIVSGETRVQVEIFALSANLRVDSRSDCRTHCKVLPGERYGTRYAAGR